MTLAAARVNAGLSKNEAAAKMKVTATELEEWESGRKDPTISQARKLSRLYNISIDNIFFAE